MDKELIDKAIDAIERAIEWHKGDIWRFSDDVKNVAAWEDHNKLLNDTLRSLKTSRL